MSFYLLKKMNRSNKWNGTKRSSLLKDMLKLPTNGIGMEIYSNYGGIIDSQRFRCVSDTARHTNPLPLDKNGAIELSSGLMIQLTWACLHF